MTPHQEILFGVSMEVIPQARRLVANGYRVVAVATLPADRVLMVLDPPTPTPGVPA